MCNLTGIAFGEGVLTASIVAGRDCLEVGSLDVNGSIRPYVESLGPARYVGIDVAPGPRVDEVVDAVHLVERFGADSFDVVITTEMLEHIRDWPTVIANLKSVVRPGGYLLVTTRSIGFPYHAFPYDFWRYEPEDMRAIFADFEIVALERDSASPGIFMLARKPMQYTENHAVVGLHSIVTGRRQLRISSREIALFRLERRARAGAQALTGDRSREVARGARRRLRRLPGTLRRRVVSPAWKRLPAPARSNIKRILRRS